MPFNDAFEFLGPLASAFNGQDRSCFLVGGAVRNGLLALPVSDVDLCGDMVPEDTASLARKAGYCAQVRPCGLGTVDISIGGLRAEYTPFRIDHYPADGSHRPLSVSFTSDLALDARRRDFTVNALYRNLHTGEITDPLDGLSDLRARRLRACGVSAGDTLMADGLRILRMVRICAELGFDPDQDLLLTAAQYAHNLSDLSPSRIFGEWSRICLCDRKYPGFASDTDKPLRAMELLHRCGALGVLLPPLYDGLGVVQNKDYHRYDVFWHNLHAFAVSSPDVALRTAALFHDIGKPHCIDPETGHMYGHAEYGATLARPLLDRLGIPSDMRREILWLILRHMFDLNGHAKDSTVRTRFANWGFAFAQKLILLRRCDVSGSGMAARQDTADKWQGILDCMLEQGAIDDPRLLAVNGRDIMRALSLPPGPRIGLIKQMLFDRCAVTPELNRPDALLREADALNRQLGKSNANNGR